MKFIYFFLFATLLPAFLYGHSDSNVEQIGSAPSGLNADSAVVTPNAVWFIFKIKQRNSWLWYQQNTPDGELEYSWYADFVLFDNRYSCGYRLFKFSDTKPKSGSFEQLIKAGQIDLSYGKISSNKMFNDGLPMVIGVTKRVNNAKVRSIIKADKLIVVLKEQKIISQLINVHPDFVLFYRKTPGNGFSKHKVALTYMLN